MPDSSSAAACFRVAGMAGEIDGEESEKLEEENVACCFVGGVSTIGVLVE